MEEAPRNLRCVVLIQKKNLGTDVGLSAFDLRDNPLFALVPKALAPRYIQQTKNLRNGHVVAWETAFRDSGRSLGQLLGQELEKSGHTRLLEGLEALPAEQRHEFVEQRLQGIDSLPALPGTISRVLELLADPEVTVEQLERVILTTNVSGRTPWPAPLRRTSSSLATCSNSAPSCCSTTIGPPACYTASASL